MAFQVGLSLWFKHLDELGKARASTDKLVLEMQLT
jgi:hypothetical protein